MFFVRSELSIASSAPTRFPGRLSSVFVLGEPLHVARMVWAAALERDAVVYLITMARAAHGAGGWAGLLALELRRFCMIANDSRIGLGVVQQNKGIENCSYRKAVISACRIHLRQIIELARCKACCTRRR